MSTFTIQALAVGAMLAGVDYVAGHVLGRPGASSILFACFVGPALLVMPLWQLVADRAGKKQGYVAASLVLATGALGLLFGRACPPGGRLSAHRRHRIGVFTGVWTAGETLGGWPSVRGVRARAEPGGLRFVEQRRDQPAGFRGDLHHLGFSVIPAGLVLLSLLALRNYTLSQSQVDQENR